MADEPRVRWATPQVLVPLLAVLAAGIYALRASPATVPPPPELAAAADPGDPTRRREVVLYLVDDGLARPLVREVADPEDLSARLQVVVDALREAMVEQGTWPSRLPAPRAFAFELERDAAAVLDLPPHDVALDVASERRIVASLQRTLLEQGFERVAFLRDGRAGGPWLGQLTVPSSLE
jgi:hypothetical protein